jgi:predicted nucleic acid-binding protein
VNVVVDTSVWSLALRRKAAPATALSHELAQLVNEGRVVMLGAIRQEILSGIRSQPQFKRLAEHLRAFPDSPLVEADYEGAASFFNRCRAEGIQGSNTDFLICSAAIRRKCAVFTTDKDFALFATLLPIRLHEPRVVL